WEGGDGMIAGYPDGDGWDPDASDWLPDYVLATTDGVIIAATHAGRVGESLSASECEFAVPVTVDESSVGLLLLSPFATLGLDGFPTAARFAWQGFLRLGVAIAVVSLVMGLAFSRRVSLPLSRLTAAARSVADGDLSVRVPTNYPGEAGELAVAFNTMAEELDKSDELRRNMTADIAHELRTPLSVIRGKLEGVLDGVYPPIAEHLEPILEETELLAHLVDDLRLLALAEAGQLPLEKRPVDLEGLVQDAQVNFGPQASDRGITLALDLPAILPLVEGDWRRISQVLGNLLTNALRHTPQGGFVTLSVVAREEEVEVAVADTGTGIPLEDQPYVFERFWRGEKSRARVSGGSGLGLAIAKQIVELHGGKIWVESVPGRGSTFRFALPRT
ncbi:MAG: ATP-binding protein, partial [Anaerolineae bacterium]|nr:ATP-binding protein [Anaerolineae bacterium]